MGISDATFYVWKKKYAGLGVCEMRKLRQLEEENRQLKQLVADLSLDKQMLRDVQKKSSKTLAKASAVRSASIGLQSIGGSLLQGGDDA